jgi:glycosyltransferase involved in cell wall biosynthesis
LGGEIVIIDAGSTDATVAIATSLGARVISNPWPGFGPQRYFGEEQCGHDFIFSLDADEIVTPLMAAEIRAVFAQPNLPPLMTIRKAMIFPHWKHPPPLGFCHDQILIYDRRMARTGPNPNWDKLDISPDLPASSRKPPRLRKCRAPHCLGECAPRHRAQACRQSPTRVYHLGQ